MKSIGFKNFRKFVEFPELKLSEITLLVGANNSGKSTLVKSILLILDYLRTQQNERLYFDKNTLNDVNIVTFGRALNNNADRNEISFDCLLYDFEIKLNCIGNTDDTFATISKIVICDKTEKIHLTIDYASDIISFELKKDHNIPNLDNAEDNIQDAIKSEIEQLKEQIAASTDFNDGLKLKYELSTLEQKLKKSILYNKPIVKSQDYTIVEYPINHRIHNENSEGVFSAFVDDFITTNKNLISVVQDKAKKTQDHRNTIVDMKYFDLHSSQINDFSKKLNSILYRNRFVYLAAHSTKQAALFSIRDKSNVLSMAIHEFYKIEVKENSDERKFVTDWMKRFRIGEDFEINLHASEAYTLKVCSDGKWVHLGDKGMGSIQIMVLILQLATIISQHKDSISGNIVIIEEPELNLHPKLQSKLADLFLTLNEKYGLRFIIETHSEYLIRRTQVMVAEKNFKDERDLADGNPFEVYYFPSSGNPYPMGYTVSGRFSEKFDEGFFDEASKSTLALSRNEIERRRING